MTVLQYNTVPAEHQPLVAEAPKKNSGRVVAAVAAALILGTAVTAKTLPVFRAASNMAKSSEKTTQLKLDTSKAGKWAPKHDMCISVEDRGKIVPPEKYRDGWGYTFPTTEERSAFLSKCYAAYGGLKAHHLPFPKGDYEGEFPNALDEKCLIPTFNLRLEKCIDGKSRQLFTVHTSFSLDSGGRIEHELPDGQIFCFNVDRDTNSVFLGFCSSQMVFVPECVGCDYFDRFDLYFKNMEPQVTFRMMPHESESFWQWPTGPKDPCMGALARTDAEGASLKAGKQYSAGAIRVVDCAKDVSPQYQLTEWLQI